MKRRVALLMAAVLAFGAGFSSYAAQSETIPQVSQEDAGSSSEAVDNAESGGTGAGGDTKAAPGNIDTAGDPSGAGSTDTAGDSSAAGGTGTAGEPSVPGANGTTGEPSVPDSTGTAEDPSAGSTEGETAGEESPQGTQTESGVPSAAIGQVEVRIGAALILKRDVTFRVMLKDAAGNAWGEDRFIKIGGDGSATPDTGSVCFQGLPEGRYTLTVSGEGFATYTQELSVSGKESVELMTGFLGGMNYATGAAHPGVLLIGDVTGEGIVNEGDRKALMEVIEGVEGASYPWADLNGDGQIDLVDLEYLTKGSSGDRDTFAMIQRFISPATINMKVGEGTQVEGDLRELLDNDKPVVLTRENPISKENPITLEFDVSAVGQAGIADGFVIESGENTRISEAYFSIEYEEVNTASAQTGELFMACGPRVQTGNIPVEEGIHFLLEQQTDVTAQVDGKGNIVVHLGSQVAIKRVILTITRVSDNSGNPVNLAEISKVEFVNGMEKRIPEPEMDIPENLQVAASSRKISLTWAECKNITGYEVEVTHVGSGDTETIMVPKNALDITSFGGKELVNYQEYQARVQSVNGTWRSGYTQKVSATPKPDRKPDRPDNVSAVGDYQKIRVSWKAMKDTVSYNLYYKKTSEGEYQKIEGIIPNNYTITGLSDSTEYTVYVTGVNEYGESGPSLSAGATTTDSYPAVIPKYGMINIGEKGKIGAHIVSASIGGGRMEGSVLDVQAGTAWGTVDSDAASYYYRGTWDDGGYNAMGAGNGLTYEFDQAYKMDTIALHDATSRDTGYFYAQVRVWNGAGETTLYPYSRVTLQSKRDQAGRVYYVIKLPEPVEVKKIQFGLARYAAQGDRITVSEVYFYYYDTLMEEIMGLYEDDLHTVLRANVTQADIDALRTRINTVDTVSGEYHPDRELLERELSTAEAILKDGALLAPVQIHGGITTADQNRGFGGLNAWQPLGVAAAAQEEIVVYVGHNSKKTGEDASLQLVATQYHAEAAAMSKVVGTLKVGPNKITVPKISSTTGMESGGALYVQYTGDGSANDRYAVRVSGGVQVPILDLYQVTDATERLNRAKAYVEALDGFVGQMGEKHAQIHQNGGNSQVAYAYEETNCILGASDILLDTMMLSLPAKQILAGMGTGTVEERAGRLLTSTDAIEDEMYLFYQHKGLNASAPEEKNQIPKGHLNIRYQRMFSGAFMYAAGNHIGIEWGSAPGLMGSPGLLAGSDGRYQSGRFFGWGIAHEIGHCINQGSYAVAEVTNNYYAVLAQAQDTNGSVRFQYANVYKKVTSGSKGAASNVFTRLGMYWQLHLAYDRGYNYKTYENYEEQLANLFFARVDTYARNPAKAPSPGNVALNLTSDGEQNLMRLSCAAAQKNLLEFFERWGMTPNEETRAYGGQFEEETRAIYYVCDDSRVYALQGKGSALGTAGSVEAVGDAVTAVVNGTDANRVDFQLGAKNIPAEDVLGYEIVRCMYAGGRVIRETAGFATENTFSDRVYMNNRVVWYEITVIDKYLNRSAVKTLSPLKIENDGSLDKSFWTVRTQGLTPVGASVPSGSEDDPCAPAPENMAVRVIDGDKSSVYTATAQGPADIVLEFNKTLTVAGFKYQTGSGMDGNYTVEVLLDGLWVEAAAGSFDGNQTNTIYFANSDGKYVSTYAASAVKLSLGGQSGEISIAELDVLGVTGDNVDFRRTQEGVTAIGRLAQDYRYGTEAADVIPKGAIVFTGSYKGNPAYNAVMLFDQDGDIVGGLDASGSLKAQYIILADVPDQGEIQNVTDGTWIYWIEDGAPEALIGVSKVRAELYRVNNALTNEGQRLVSDSLFENVPADLPEIRLDGGSVPQ